MPAVRARKEGCVNRIGGLISPLVKGLGIEDALRLESMRKEWAGLAGEPLSLHIGPASLKGGELLVYADSPAWLQQTTFFKAALIKKLSSFGVKNVRFMLGRVRPAGKKQAPVLSRPPDAPLDSGTLRYIEDAVAGVKDAELRDCIRKTMEKAMRTRPASRKSG